MEGLKRWRPEAQSWSAFFCEEHEMAFYTLDQPDQLNLAGFALNVEEYATLSSSLIVKRDEEKASEIALWGKLLGIQADYYICHSYSPDKLFTRKYFYSLDASTWFELPVVSPADIATCEKIQGRLTGDPAAEHDVPKDGKPPLL